MKHLLSKSKTFALLALSLLTGINVLFGASSFNANAQKTEAAPSGTTIYCKMEHSWWYADDAAIGAYCFNNSDSDKNANWPGVRMTIVPGTTNIWSYTLTKSYDNVIFTRVNGSGAIADWGAKTKDDYKSIPTNGNNLFTITSSSAVWGDPGCDGNWSYYGSYSYYIVGSEWNNWSTSPSDMPKFTLKSDSTTEYEIENLVIHNDNAEFKYYYIGGPEGYGNPNKDQSGPKSGDYSISFNGDNGVINKAGTYNVYLTPSNGKMWFNVQKYDVTYDVNSATSGSNSTQTGFIDQPFTTRASTEISKTGYTFKGWNTKSDGSGTNYAADTVVDLGLSAGDSLTLYANWSPNTDTPYTVQHRLQNTSRTKYEVDGARTQSLTGITGTNTNAQALTIEGFTAKTIAQQTIAGDGSTIVNVDYDRNSYTLTFNPDGGTCSEASRTVYHGCQFGDLPIPTKTVGIEFGGWYTGIGGTGTLISSSTLATGNLTVYAKWVSAVVKHNVTLTPGMGMTGTAQTTQVAEGSTFTIPSTNPFTLDGGYVFKEWTDGINTYAPGANITMGTSDITLTSNARIQYDLKITHSGSTTTIPFTYGSSKFTIAEVSVIKEDIVELYDYSTSIAGTKVHAGINGDSDGCWRDNGTTIISDEETLQTFSIEIKPGDENRDKYLLTKYTGTVETEYSVYVGGTRYVMTQTSDTPEGFTAQYKATTSGALKDEKVTFKSNKGQMDFAVSRDATSNTYIGEDGKQHIKAGNDGVLDIYLKIKGTVGSETYSSFVSGLRSEKSGYTLIIQNNTANTIRAIDLESDSPNNQFVGLDVDVNEGDYIYLFKNENDDFRNFQNGEVKPDGSVPNSFEKDNSNNAKCNETGKYNIYVKSSDFLWNVNSIYFAKGGNPETDAIAFAQGFNTAIGAECYDQGGHKDTLKSAWDAQASLFATLSDQAKAYFNGSSTSSDTNIINCLVKYDYVFTKYWGVLFTKTSDDFMARHRDSYDSTVINLPKNLNTRYLLSESSDKTTLINVIASSGLLLLSASVLLFFLKKKKKQD